MENRLDLPEHEWAVVSGASDGIGQAIARALASRGINLILVARRADRLHKLAAQLQRDFAVQCRALDVNLGERDAVERVMLAQQHCNVSLLVAAAGFGSSGNFLDLPLDDELSMVDVNCRAIVELTHKFGRIFADRGSGTIILFSSLFAFQGVGGAATYAATKAFIQSFAEGLEHEFGRAGVNVLEHRAFIRTRRPVVLALLGRGLNVDWHVAFCSSLPKV